MPVLPEMTNPPIARSVKGSGEAAGLGTTYIYEKISTGELKAHKAGRRTLILHDDLVAFLKSLPEMKDV